ncbi:MAG: hypothetical protein IPF52_16245 [Saprospiraceae bacterium]|nr:hypothetical protein [Saprospiraceae bacterium]
MKILKNSDAKKNISFFLIFIMMFYSTSCNYYKVKKVTGNDNLKIHNIGNLHKKMIVHVGEETFVLEDTKVDSLLLSGKLSYADSTTFYYNEGNKISNTNLKKEYFAGSSFLSYRHRDKTSFCTNTLTKH